MIKLYYTFGFCALIAAIIIFSISCIGYINKSTYSSTDQEAYIISIFKTNFNNMSKSEVPKLHPLINQAQQFAGIINPPKPPKPIEISIPKPKPKPTPKPIEIVQKPKEETVKFNLIATSYNQLKPTESLALVSEPDKGSYWIKQGDTIGNYVVKSVEHKSLVFEDGDKKQKITVGSQVAVLADSDEGSINITDTDTLLDTNLVAASDVPERLLPKPVTKHKSSTRIRKPLQKLGPQRQRTSLVALDNK